MRKLVLLLMLGIIVNYVHAQKRTITGIVTSQNKTPLFGASVTVPGTNIGAITNSSGIFTISVPASVKSLEISSVGHKVKTVSIGTANSISVTLEEGVSSQL